MSMLLRILFLSELEPKKKQKDMVGFQCSREGNFTKAKMTLLRHFLESPLLQMKKNLNIFRKINPKYGVFPRRKLQIQELSFTQETFL